MNGLQIPKPLKIVTISIAVLLLLYAILGFLVLPAVLSDQIPKLAKEQVNREVTIGDIRFNPFSMEFTIQDLQVDELDNSPFAKFNKLYVNVAVLDSLFDLSLKMDQLLLEAPYISIKRDKKADFNFTTLINKEVKEQEKQPENNEIFPFTISQISISDGKISWSDNLYATLHQEDIYPLDLDVKNFTTIVNEQSQLGFSLMVASGGELDWKGNIKLNPFESSGHIELNNIDFHKVWQLFLQESVNFTILKGSELIKADYHLTESNEVMQLLISNADIALRDIQLAEKGLKDSLITIPDFSLSGISLDLLKQNVEINKISSTDANFKAWLNSDGVINYQALFVSNAVEAKKPVKAVVPEPAPTEDNSQPWNILVKQLQIANYSFDFTDKTLASPAHFEINSINLSSSELSTQQGASLPFDLALNFNKTGNLKVKGQAVLEPLSSKIELNINNIALKDFQSYVDQFVRLDIVSGLFNVNANIALQQKKDSPLAVTFKGDSSIDKLVTRDQIANKDFVNWKKLSLTKIDLDIAANSYNIDSIKIDRPYARVLIKKNKTTNIDDIVIDTNKGKETKTKEQPAKNKETEPAFKINHFVITEGKSDFSDRSLILPFSARINHLKGSVKGISSNNNATIKIALDGRVAELSPVSIKGQITPSKDNSNFKVDFNSMPLPLMTPYMAEFAGRKIEKGNMSLNFEYKIQNKKLTASNNLLIDQLVLGDSVENPDAVSLPLGLAIALLQDSDGKIILDVPVTGDLDNPEFSVGSIIIDALVNVITKIVTSPFNAIASLIDSDEDISKIEFSAGNAALNEKQHKKLDNLVTALSKRPALKLEIQGAAYSVQDWPEMQASALDKQILQLRADELIKKDSKAIIPEQLGRSDEDYQRLLADLFITKFSTMAERSFLGTPRLIDPTLGDFYQVAQNKLAALIPPDNQTLHDLASSRAKAIAKYLVEKEIEIQRMFILNVDIDPKDAEDNSIISTLGLKVD